MLSELDVLKMVGERLSNNRFQFMLTGSLALAYYATPRMTRDLDVVVDLREADVDRLTGVFRTDFYLDPEDARAAVVAQRMFNLMHLETGIKVDFIVRKATEYREAEFLRRRAVGSTKSEMQLRDIKSLVHASRLEQVLA